MKFNPIKIIPIFMAAVTCLFAQTADKNYPKIKAVVIPGSTTIGEQLEYRVNLAGRGIKDIEILLPEKRVFYPAERENDDKAIVASSKSDSLSEKKPDPSENVPLYIIHNAKKEDRSDESMLYLTVVMQISYYRPGKYMLPDIEILDSEKVKIGYKIPEVEIKELNKEGQYQEIEPPLDLGGNYYRLIFLMLGAVVLTALVIFLIRYIKKKRDERALTPVVVPPIEIFLKEMQKFKGEKLIKSGRVEEYIVGISMIFRRFLSSLLSIDAVEMTTEEIDRNMGKLLSGSIYDKYRDVIMQSFNLWDLSKFAELTPSNEMLLINLDKTVRLAENLSEDIYDIPNRV